MSIELDNIDPLGRRGLIASTNLAITGLIAILATTKIVVMGAEHTPIPALIIISVGLANAVYLRRNGSMDIAARVLICLTLLGLAIGGYNTGGFDAALVILSPIIPILTMLLIGSRAAIISLGLVCFILSALFVLGLNGLIPNNINNYDVVLFARFLVLISLCFISTWVVWRFSTISKALLVKLDKQSNTDFLTRVLNRRAIESTLEKEVGRARRSKTWLSIIMADVDFFKLYNDSNGHQMGDQCLVDIASVITSCCERTTDVVGRFGGEEFVLILPDTDSEGARQVAESIRNKVLEKKIAYGPENQDFVSLTFGVVSALGADIENNDQLIKHADAALYRGKDEGRNCVVSHTLSDEIIEG